MKLTRTMVLAVCAVALSVGAGAAQSLRDAQGPAELPPASFKGTQYVDSRGCVFIRAGIDGNVTWVPRVTRAREQICGQTPTLSAGTVATTQTVPERAPAPVPNQPRAANAPVAEPPVTRTTQPVVARPAPVPVPAATSAPTPAERPDVVMADSASSIAGPTTRVVPRHVFEQRSLKRPARVPEGYEPVWDDDRLNPRRAEQNLNGIAQTRLVWTRTVPRRLIDRSTGQDMTARVPLVFPYTDIDTQERDLGRVTLIRQDGQTVKRVQRKSRVKARAPAVTKATVTGRYVQIGTFGVADNAQAAAQSIVRAGLPARIGKIKRNGKSYQIVLAGPFASFEELSNGLQQSRAVGFRDAFVRK
ncbi:MAG: SPOR domain-containing protein [Pseudomonadota bacterium]